MKRRLPNISMVLTMLAAWIPLPVLADSDAGQPDYWHHGWTWGWGHMMAGSLMMVLFLGGLIALVILTIRLITDRTPPGKGRPESGNTAQDIVRGRLARGEIDEAEFAETMRLLAESRAAEKSDRRESAGVKR